jgi:hypothetical protein
LKIENNWVSVWLLHLRATWPWESHANPGSLTFLTSRELISAHGGVCGDELRSGTLWQGLGWACRAFSMEAWLLFLSVLPAVGPRAVLASGEPWALHCP